MLREYKFIVKIKEEGKLINWFEVLGFLCDTIECNNYDFIENKIWISIKDHNELTEKGIELGDIQF